MAPRDDDNDALFGGDRPGITGYALEQAVSALVEALRDNDPESWNDMGGTMEGVTPNDITDMVMEEMTPQSIREWLLTEYDEWVPLAENPAGAGYRPFLDAVERHIMGYPNTQGAEWTQGDVDDMTDEELVSLPSGLRDYEGHAVPFDDPSQSDYRINSRSDDPLFRNSKDEIFDDVWATMKGKFRGYTRNTISGRAERQGKARAWSQSRKVKRGRTRKKYARNKARGNVRPSMRRQLGAGGKRKETKR